MQEGLLNAFGASAVIRYGELLKIAAQFRVIGI